MEVTNYRFYLNEFYMNGGSSFPSKITFIGDVHLGPSPTKSRTKRSPSPRPTRKPECLHPSYHIHKPYFRYRESVPIINYNDAAALCTLPYVIVTKPWLNIRQFPSIMVSLVSKHAPRHDCRTPFTSVDCATNTPASPAPANAPVSPTTRVWRRPTGGPNIVDYPSTIAMSSYLPEASQAWPRDHSIRSLDRWAYCVCVWWLATDWWRGASGGIWTTTFNSRPETLVMLKCLQF